MNLEGDVVGISACASRVVTAFREGSAIIQRLKTKCAEQRAPAPPRLLEESIDQAPDEIEKEKLQAIARHGHAFEQGDYLAVIALQQVTIDLQSDLLYSLRNAVAGEAVPDYGSLVDTADHARDRTIAILRELGQRLQERPSSEHERRVVAPLDIDSPFPSSREVSDTPSPQPRAVRQAKTWHREPSTSADPSGDETAMNSGNDDEQTRSGRKRHSSILGILTRHQRSRSNDLRDMADGGRAPPDSPGGPFSRKPVDNSDSFRVLTPNSDFMHDEEEQLPSDQWAVRVSDETARQASVATTADGGSSTASSAGQRSSRGGSIAAIATPTPDNDYLGFCRGAWRLQNGDRGAVQKAREFNDGWSQSVVYFLMCAQSKCAFAGHFPLDRIWDKVWTVDQRGLKFRWAFLAKSHVSQSRVRDNIFWYQCLFCVFSGDKSPRLQGTDRYLSHLQQHRNDQHNEVLLYKTRCIVDRVADDQEDFDINLWPENCRLSALMHEPLGSSVDENSSLAVQPPNADGGSQSWVDGLPDFQYKCEFDRAEFG